MSLLRNLLRGQRSAQDRTFYGGGANAQMLSLRDMLFRRAGQMPYTQGAHVLRTNSLSPDADANLPANTQANLSANTQANLPANLQANLPANTQANLPANTQANLPANTQANLPANTQANLPANTQANVPALVTKATAPVEQATPAAPRRVTVKPGDTLSTIALRELGKASRWSEIYALNRALIANPDRITPGQTFVLPLAGNNNVPVNVPNNLPEVPVPNNVPAQTNTPANIPAQTNTPANIPAQTNTPANVPAQTNTPANVPAQTNTPADTKTPVQTDENTAAKADEMVLRLSGLLSLMKTNPNQAAPTDNAGKSNTSAQTNATQLPPQLALLAKSTAPVTGDPEALQVLAAARASLTQANPQLAATAQGQQLIQTYALVIANLFKTPAHQKKPPEGSDWVAKAKFHAERNARKRILEAQLQATQDNLIQSTQQANTQTNTQVVTQTNTQTNTQTTEVQGQRPMPGTPAYEAVFNQHLTAGIAILQKAGLKFGRADNQTKGRFDAAHWAVKGDPQYGAMLEHTGGLPHQAIDEMFANVSKWSMDCAEFVQAAQLYAQRHALGAETFDKKYGSAKLTLRVHGSAGVSTQAIYHQESPGASPVAVTPQGKRAIDQSMDDVLKAAPVGSRVMWTNPYAPTSSAWLNENSVKLGDDVFAAHPMGTLPRAAIEKRLHNANGATANKASKVFLRQVEYYYKY